MNRQTECIKIKKYAGISAMKFIPHKKYCVNNCNEVCKYGNKKEK